MARPPLTHQGGHIMKKWFFRTGHQLAGRAAALLGRKSKKNKQCFPYVEVLEKRLAPSGSQLREGAASLHPALEASLTVSLDTGLDGARSSPVDSGASGGHPHGPEVGGGGG